MKPRQKKMLKVWWLNTHVMLTRGDGVPLLIRSGAWVVKYPQGFSCGPA